MIPLTNAYTTVRTLPSNTILFDDFSGGLKYCSSQTGSPVQVQSGICNYYNQDNCGNWGTTCEVVTNSSMLTPDGQSTIEIRDNGGGAFGIQDFRRTFTYDHTRTMSVTFVFAFSCNMQSISGSQDIGMSLEYPDNANPAQHQEFRVRFQPNVKQWQYKHGSGTWSNIVYPAGTRAFYPGIGCNPVTIPHYNYGWEFITITGTPSTGTYSSIQTPEGIWGCTGNTGLTSGCVPNNDEGTDQSCGNSNINSCMAIEMQVDTGASPTSPGYWSGYLGSVLVQDVTPGNPNFIQFATYNGLLGFAGILGVILIVWFWRPLLNMFNMKSPRQQRTFTPTGEKYYTPQEIEQQFKRRVKIIIALFIISAIAATFAIFYGGL